MSGVATVYLGLGSNLGDRLAHLRFALAQLEAAGVAVEAVSRVYETEPWGEPPPGLDEPPPYANAALRARTALEPAALLDLCKRLEVEAGRDLDAPRNSPRPLDIDILLYGEEVIATPRLRVPHPRAAERAFVLVPLAEVAADAVHPELGRTIGELRDEVGDAGVELLAILDGWSLDGRGRLG